MFDEWNPGPQERESVCGHPKYRLKLVRGSVEYTTNEEVDHDAHKRNQLHPGGEQIEKASEVAVPIHQLQFRVVIDPGQGVRERVEEGSNGKVEDQPLREEGVLPINCDEQNHREAAQSRECPHAGPQCSHCRVGSRVELVQARVISARSDIAPATRHFAATAVMPTYAS